MKVIVTYQYPGVSSVTIEIPEEIILHPVSNSLLIAFSEFVAGIKTFEVLRSNIHYLMQERGYITKDAEILSIEIFPNK